MTNLTNAFEEILESIINTFHCALSFIVININNKKDACAPTAYVSLSDIILILIKYKDKKDKGHFYEELVYCSFVIQDIFMNYKIICSILLFIY